MKPGNPTNHRQISGTCLSRVVGSRRFQDELRTHHEPIHRWGETLSSPGIVFGGKVRARRSLAPPRFIENLQVPSRSLGAMSRALARERFGVRRPSGALADFLESGRGLPHSKTGRRKENPAQAGFTMIEIALSLGIIAFALVALMGVLPSGVKVQKENREETIINQDGGLILETIRSGAKGVDFLTNHFEAIVAGHVGNVSLSFTNRLYPGPVGVTTGSVLPITDGQQIVGLLSWPYRQFSQLNPNSSQPSTLLETSVVEARVRAISGVASDKGKQVGDFAFRYLLRVEITPFVRPPLQWIRDTKALGILSVGSRSEIAASHAMLNNLYEVRLTMRWPVYLEGNTWRTGRHRKTFRTLVSGELNRFVRNNAADSGYYFQPNSFSAITNISKPRF